ncbi:hypothetical protein CRI88_06445 [Lysinibacillus fusiformis]|uniref:Uncharacterized protein n=1 Tax=Lysinibacillus fusiformis TaxID=28031 RepID=A0A2I0V168_9BACI|nr:hypothetical protein CRI88_06445 [Lysinibacillus fusiformis]
MSEAAHRTSPGKDAGGMEINPSPFKIAYSAVDITFFQQHRLNTSSTSIQPPSYCLHSNE